ncbi:MAG: hypothetical protein A2Z08_08695 [Deltaproteobacteria bacterium RBG_16_54_11]|nr:MAG: hypothetical protein A2Z08_08695 [Deltaproteobacteria bacterium RBG_16_54_11]
MTKGSSGSALAYSRQKTYNDQPYFRGIHRDRALLTDQRGTSGGNLALAGKVGNPPSPPFSKGGMAGGGPLARGFETYFLGNGYEDTVYPL